MRQKKDALFLCQFFYPEYITSAQLPYDAVNTLSAAGYQVDVMCGYPKEYNLQGEVPIREQLGTTTIHRIKYVQLKRSNFLGRIINYLSFTMAVALRFLRMRNYQCLFVYSNPPILPIVAALASKIFGCSLVFVNFDIYPEIAVKTGSIATGSIIYRTMTFANRFIFKNTSKVIAISNEMKEYILTHRSGLHSEQIEVVPNWCHDDERLSGNEPIRHEQLRAIRNDNRLVVSYFGNMGICQDMDTILEAIRYLNSVPDIHFVFAGHGNKLEAIREAIKTEQLKHVTVFDYLHGQDFVDALRISDCFLASLVNGLAGLCVPSKIYSYLSAAKPVISIMEDDFEIVQDIIGHAAGCYIRQGDSNRLADTLLALRDDPDRLTVMGRQSRIIFEQKYTYQTCSGRYVKILGDLLDLRSVNNKKARGAS